MQAVVLRDYLKNFKNDFGEAAQVGVLNCLRIIDYAHDGDMSGEDFSELDLRMCSIVGKNARNTEFPRSYISQRLFMPQGHRGEIQSVSYSPDGKSIISASDFNNIRVWNSETGGLIHTLEGRYRASFSPDGRCIVSVSGDNAIKIWNSDTGSLIQTLAGHTGLVSNVCYSPDGKYIISWSCEDNEIKIWSCETGELLHVFCWNKDPAYIGHVTNVFCTPDVKRIITTFAYDDDTRIWDIETHELLSMLEGRGLCCSFDGKYIALVLKNDRIKILNIEIGDLMCLLEGHKDWGVDASFSPNSKLIAAVSGNTVRIWDSMTGKLLRIIEVGDYPHCVRFSPDDTNIVIASDYNSIKVFDCATGKLMRTFGGHIGYVHSASYSPDGKYLACVALGYKQIRILNSETAELIRTLDGHTARVNSACYSPDGKHIVSASDDKTIKIWSSESGELFRTLMGHTEKVNSACYSTDGKYIVSASGDNTVIIWDSETGELIRPLMGHTDWVNSASFSPNGKYVVSTSGDYMVKIWNSKTAEFHNIYCGDTDEDADYVINAFYTPNGSHIILVFKWLNTVKILNSETMEVVSCSEHKNLIENEIFSPDGQYIVSLSSENVGQSRESNRLLWGKTYYDHSIDNVLGSNFWNVKHDDLTEQDFFVLKQSGAIFEEVSSPR
jgi:WD40 repeat protein